MSPLIDDPLIVGVTLIRAVHITELRARIDAQRVIFGLPVYAWSGSSVTRGAIVSAQHILDLRLGLAQAYARAGRSVPAYTDPALGPGTSIKAVHLTELRAAIVALEYAS
jgi:hypothetical protein